MQQTTEERVSFTMHRTACALYPIATIHEARKQVHAERIVCELSDSGHAEAIGFDYHVEATGHETDMVKTDMVKTDVVLTISGSDELLVREVARRLDEHYHGQPFYELEMGGSYRAPAQQPGLAPAPV